MKHIQLVLVLLCLTFFVCCQQGNQVNCGTHTTCDACTNESSCVWCETDQTCVSGGFFGPATFFPSCSSWRHKQCYINGRWYTWYPIWGLLIILFIAGCCVLITLLLCNPCTYVYKKWKKKGDYVRWEEMQKEMDTMGEKPPTEQQQRREGLRKKWLS